MGLRSLSIKLRHRTSPWPRLVASVLFCSLASWAQAPQVQFRTDAQTKLITPTQRAQRFLRGRTTATGASAAQALVEARAQQAQLVQQQAIASPRITGLNAAWQPVGPAQVASLSYGNITGRVTSIAIDPADSSGNTVYLGTTGGGVWKSTNAAGPATSVTFTPLTDTLPVFSESAGNSAIPSLSIGAVSVGQGVGQSIVLAGTGDPNDSTDSFYGGGLLRSIDGGVTWTLIQGSRDGVEGNHSWVGLGFAGFAWSTASPGTVVAAVSQAAEGVIVNAASTTNSVMGLYYSTDSGATWQMSILMDGGQTVQTPQLNGFNNGGNAVTSVAWNPIRQRFYAAIRYHGYYQSADGITWTRLTTQPGTGLTTSVCPPSPNTAGSLACPIFRGALAVNATTGDTFALTVDGANLDQGLWQDVCASNGSGCTNSVAFGTKLNATPLEAGNGSNAILQGDYNLALAASPVGSGATVDTLLYVGTVDLYRCSLAAGCTLRNTTNALNGCAALAKVAPAQHAIATLATTSQPLVYLGNDGGFWRSTDGVNQQGTPCSSTDASHFDNLNSGLGSLAEVVSFAQDPINENTLLAGLGASGTAATGSSSSTLPWPQISQGEGGMVVIDAAQPSLWYVSTAAGVNIRQCTAGSACTFANFTGAPTIGEAQVSSDVSAVDAPWLLDPALDSNLIVGTCRVWRGPANSGALWSSSNAISTMLGGTQSPACTTANPVLRSLAAGGATSGTTAAQNAGSQVIYAGMAGALDGGGTSAGGHLFGTTAAGTASSTTSWTDLATSTVTNDTANQGKFNPGRFDLSSITVDPHDATGATVYATVMGFSNNGISEPLIYRSTNSGISWTNITSNLPNAPANSVVVDPNDANTLYIAMDTGVYATSQITTCATANCWSIYGIGLPNAPVVQLAAAAGMSTGDGRNGELRAATYGRGIWQIPLLTASTAAQAALSVSPTSLSFTSQAVGTVSAAQTVTVTNSGNAPLSVSQITATGDFNEADTCIGTSIAVNQSCTVQVAFLPTTTGNRTGTLTVYGNVAGGQATVPLSGTATPASTVVLNPIALTFPTTPVGSASTAENITISNTGTATVTLQTPTVTGDYKITANTCGTTLASQTGCTVAITFSPTASGARTGTLTITDGAGTQTASLTGTGTLPATDGLSPASLSFPTQQIGTSSASQQVTLTNTGDVALTLITASTSGDFSVVNSCGNSLNGHASCAMSVIFQPKNIGQETGTLTISDQYRTQTVTLSGIGVAPPGVSLAPVTGLTFAATGVGISSTAQTVTLTNNGGTTLAISGINLTGDFAIVSGGNTCGATLAPSTACTLKIIFTPTFGGPRTGSLAVTDNAPSSPQIIPLAGAGVDFTLQQDGATTVSITNGQSAVFPLLLSSAANVTGTVTMSCVGAPSNAICNVTPATITLGNTATLSATVQTGITTTSSAIKRQSIWFALTIPFGLLIIRRRRLGAAMLLTLMIFTAGCGSGRRIPGTGGTSGSPTGPATPSGTYTIVVSATSAGITRAMNLTLIVQ